MRLIAGLASLSHLRYPRIVTSRPYRKAMTTTVRTCRYDHGPLDELPDTWALSGVEWVSSSKLDPPGSTKLPQQSTQAFFIKLWRCPTCGYMELQDT